MNRRSILINRGQRLAFYAQNSLKFTVHLFDKTITNSIKRCHVHPVSKPFADFYRDSLDHFCEWSSLCTRVEVFGKDLFCFVRITPSKLPEQILPAVELPHRYRYPFDLKKDAGEKAYTPSTSGMRIITTRLH